MNTTNLTLFWPFIITIIILIVLHVNHYKHYKKFLTNWQSILLSHLALGFYIYFCYYFYHSKTNSSYKFPFAIINYLGFINIVGSIYKMRTKNTSSKYYNLK